jgi:hypothetical protein
MTTQPKPSPEETRGRRFEHYWKKFDDVKDFPKMLFIKSFFKKELAKAEKRMVKKWSHRLYLIRASIPMTHGKVARKMIKELIEELEGGEK